MSQVVTTETPVASPVAAPVAAPSAAIVDTPVVAPVASPAVTEPATAADVPAVAPVADPAPVVVAEAPAVDPAKVEAPAADPAAVVEAPAAVDPNAPKPEAEVAPAVVAPKYEFKIPEAVKMDEAQVSAYSNVLGKYNISPEAGQELLEYGASMVKAETERLTQQQHDVFAETRRGWVQEFDKGAGNRRDTILNDAKFAITDTIKDTKQRQALWDALGATGAGDHPLVINALAKIGKRLRENTAPAPETARNGAKTGSAADRRYGGSR